MSSNRTTIAVLFTVLVVGSGFAMTGAVSAQTTPGNAPTATGLVVTSLSAPDSAAPNSTVAVSATVENPDSTGTTELVEFRVAGTVADREWVTLGPGEQTTVALEADTTGIPPGDYVHGVFTDSDASFDTITISESFTVDGLDAPANATSGETITVGAAVTNPNDGNATQQIRFRFDGGVLVEESLTLGPGETTNVSLNVSLAGVAEGTYVHGLFTRDSGQQASLSVTPSNATAEPATVNFSDQQSDGQTVVVDSVTLPEGGFVTIHDDSLLDGNVVGSVIGVSQALEPGTYENLTVPLFTVPGGPSGELSEDATLIAMPHLDTNGNDIYDFVTSGGTDDGPYLVNGSAVTDAANVSAGPAEPPAPPEETPGEGPPETPPGEPPGEGPPAGNGTGVEGETTATPTDGTPTDGTPGTTPAGESGTPAPAETTAPASLSDLVALVPGPF